MIDNFYKNGTYTVFNIAQRLVNLFLEYIEFLYAFWFCLLYRCFDFTWIDVHRCELLKIFFWFVYNNFQRLYFVVLMALIVTHAAYDTVLDTARLQAYQIENLSNMISPFTAFGIFELLYFGCSCVTHILNIFYKRYFNSYKIFIGLFISVLLNHYTVDYL